jgi:hypothetical protein
MNTCGLLLFFSLVLNFALFVIWLGNESKENDDYL